MQLRRKDLDFVLSGNIFLLYNLWLRQDPTSLHLVFDEDSEIMKHTIINKLQKKVPLSINLINKSKTLFFRLLHCRSCLQ